MIALRIRRGGLARPYRQDSSMSNRATIRKINHGRVTNKSPSLFSLASRLVAVAHSIFLSNFKIKMLAFNKMRERLCKHIQFNFPDEYLCVIGITPIGTV